MRPVPISAAVASLPEQGTRNAAFYLFCAFIVSYLLHLTARAQVLGAMHFDLLLAALTALAIVLGRSASAAGRPAHMDPVAKRLWLLLAYILVTIPFVEWPGSVVHNLEGYAKSLCFFFFVLATVDTTRKLKILLAVYVAAQLFRVLEPLYLHLTSGYWGSFTSLGNWEYMDRLSGSPYDIINPNGLGFVIIMTLPLLHFLVAPDTPVRRLVWAALACAMCYALVLSASRSGFLAFVFLCLFVIWRSKYRAPLLAVAVVGAIVAFGLMTDLQRGRYLSIVSHDAPGAATAEGRIAGVIADFQVSLRRPLFGHGLGTSRETNAHYRGEDRPSHNMYTEAAEELGYIGLLLLMSLIWSFLRACQRARQVVNAAPNTDQRLRLLHSVADALLVVVCVDLFFSFASFGLSEPYWYFVGGLSVVTVRLAVKLAPAEGNAALAREASAGTRGSGARRRARMPFPRAARGLRTR
jgi:O-antigen ligase/polysaccharide polymerase Wzy-like membrane protein